MPSDKKLLGAFGEDAACRYLVRRGYKILGRNFTCRFGEIDLIARKRGFVVFAERWLQLNPTDLQPRFDVIEVYAPQGLDTKRPEINHLEDAFGI